LKASLLNFHLQGNTPKNYLRDVYLPGNGKGNLDKLDLLSVAWGYRENTILANVNKFRYINRKNTTADEEQFF